MGQKHLRHINGSGCFSLAGICDLDPARRSSDAPYWTSLSEAITASRAEAALIAVPPQAHAACAYACLNAGLAVLMEKPLATSFAQASELSQAFAAAKVILQPAMVERFNPAWQALRQRLASESIHAIHIRREGGMQRTGHAIGVGHDLAIHDLDLLLDLFPGLQRENLLREGTAGNEHRLEMRISTQGADVHLCAAWDLPPCRTWTIETAAGTYAIDLRRSSLRWNGEEIPLPKLDALAALQEAFAHLLERGETDQAGLARVLSALALLET
jgi:predicted dehydrogenase